MKYQEKMKALFEKKAKDREFQGDLVLKWDVGREDKRKHVKFDDLWFEAFKIDKAQGKNTFLLDNIHGENLQLPIKGKYLKHYFQH